MEPGVGHGEAEFTRGHIRSPSDPSGHRTDFMSTPPGASSGDAAILAAPREPANWWAFGFINQCTAGRRYLVPNDAAVAVINCRGAVTVDFGSTGSPISIIEARKGILAIGDRSAATLPGSDFDGVQLRRGVGCQRRYYQRGDGSRSINASDASHDETIARGQSEGYQSQR